MSPDGMNSLQKMGSGSVTKSGFTFQLIACRPKASGTAARSKVWPGPSCRGQELLSSSCLVPRASGLGPRASGLGPRAPPKVTDFRRV